jgi:hypothetical protein
MQKTRWKWNPVIAPNTITEEFLRRFKSGDLVDVRTKHLKWHGPHKLLVFKLDPRKKDAKPAAYINVEIGNEKLERRLIVGDQKIIRKHVPVEQK